MKKPGMQCLTFSANTAYITIRNSYSNVEVTFSVFTLLFTVEVTMKQ